MFYKYTVPIFELFLYNKDAFVRGLNNTDRVKDQYKKQHSLSTKHVTKYHHMIKCRYNSYKKAED